MNVLALRSKAFTAVQLVLAIDRHATSLTEDYPLAYGVFERHMPLPHEHLYRATILQFLTYADDQRQHLTARFFESCHTSSKKNTLFNHEL